MGICYFDLGDFALFRWGYSGQDQVSLFLVCFSF
jgi:hypothetical protein